MKSTIRPTLFPNMSEINRTPPSESTNNSMSDTDNRSSITESTRANSRTSSMMLQATNYTTNIPGHSTTSTSTVIDKTETETSLIELAVNNVTSSSKLTTETRNYTITTTESSTFSTPTNKSSTTLSVFQSVSTIINNVTNSITDMLTTSVTNSTQSPISLNTSTSITNVFETSTNRNTTDMLDISTSTDHDLPNKHDPVSPGVVFTGFIMLGVVSLVGAVGTVLTIWAVFKHRNLRRMSNIYIVNLAVVDFIVSALLTPVSMYTMITDDQPPGCDTVLPFISMTCTSVSILNFSAIAVNRYLAIMKSPSVYNKYFSNIRTIISVVAIWILGGLVSLPPLVGFGHYGYDVKFGICFIPGGSRENYWYTLGICTVFTMPFFITTGFSYSQIMLKFRRIQKRRQSYDNPRINKNPVTDNDVSLQSFSNVNKTVLSINNDVKIAHDLKYIENDASSTDFSYDVSTIGRKKQRKSTKRVRQQMDMFRVAFNCVVIWVFYLVVWTPVLGLHMADYYFRVPPAYYRLLFVIAYTNFAVNALIYAGLNRNFRDVFKDILLCKICTEAQSNESQTGTSSDMT